MSTDENHCHSSEVEEPSVGESSDAPSLDAAFGMSLPRGD